MAHARAQSEQMKHFEKDTGFPKQRPEWTGLGGMCNTEGQMYITFNHRGLRENYEYVLTFYEAQAELGFVISSSESRYEFYTWSDVFKDLQST